MTISIRRYYITQSICMVFGASIMAVIFVHPLFVILSILYGIAYLWITTR
jgi:hypothetical protein